MAYTALELITKSYYLSGVVSQDLQTVTGVQASNGLDLLNEVLAIKTANEKLIPYYKNYDLTLVTGQEKYFIPNLLAVETFTFNIGPVRYAMQYQDRRNYFGSGRVDNINSLPFNWHTERVLGGTNLYMYFSPEANYPSKIFGKFGLDQVPNLSFDLSTTDDLYYISYLRYALAEYICESYTISLQPQVEKKLKEYEAIIMNISPPDMTISKLSTFAGSSGLTWGDVNLGRGWRPGT